MRDPATEIAPGTIRFERNLPGPVNRVWDYLTHPTIRGRWLGSGPMDLREGGAFEITFRPDELTPHAEVPPEKHYSPKAVTVRGEVKDVKFPFILTLSWPATGADSTVGFVLTQVHGLVRLTLTHGGIESREKQIETAAFWHAHLNIFEAKSNMVLPPPFWKRFAEYEEKYAGLFPGQAPAS